MPTIPAITPTIVVRKRRLQALEAHIRRTHDGLPEIVKAVDHVPVVVVLEHVARRHAAVDGDNGVQAVQLVRHAGGEDGGVGPDDWGREVGVEGGVGDGLETHAD